VDGDAPHRGAAGITVVIDERASAGGLRHPSVKEIVEPRPGSLVASISPP
jgi:hypothetical protein